MFNFIRALVCFMALIVPALRANAAHQRQQFYSASAYHKPWWVLFNPRWIRINLLGLWAIARDDEWKLTVFANDEDNTSGDCFAASCGTLPGDPYYWVIKTPYGGVPWPMVGARFGDDFWPGQKPWLKPRIIKVWRRLQTWVAQDILEDAFHEGRTKGYLERCSEERQEAAAKAEPRIRRRSSRIPCGSDLDLL